MKNLDKGQGVSHVINLENIIGHALEEELKRPMWANNDNSGGEWLVGEEDYPTYMNEDGIIECHTKINEAGEPVEIKKFKFTMLVEEITEVVDTQAQYVVTYEKFSDGTREVLFSGTVETCKRAVLDHIKKNCVNLLCEYANYYHYDFFADLCVTTGKDSHHPDGNYLFSKNQERIVKNSWHMLCIF